MIQNFRALHDSDCVHGINWYVKELSRDHTRYTVRYLAFAVSTVQ